MQAMFVTGSLAHGGAERHSITLLNRLAARGHECHAVYIKDAADQLDRIRLRGRGTLCCLNARRYFDLRSLAAFAAHISRVAPAVIVAANTYALMYASLALRLSGLRAPLVVTFHSTQLLGLKEQLQMALYRLFFWIADCSVFVCEGQRRYWRRRGVFSRRNEVIYNGVDIDEFCDHTIAEEGGRLRAAGGFSGTDYVVGMLAVLRPEKNHVQMVEAISLLRGLGIPARALMIGDGGMRPAVEARARELGIERHIVITGFQQEVRPYIAACDAVALCSRTEAFSLAAIEAMAMRRPVVHADVGGAPEMISSGWNGYLFPAGDAKALAARLALLADRALAARMGQHAREAVEARFSEGAMVNRYENVLKELCA